METNGIEQTVRTDVRLGCRYDVLAFVCARPSASRRAEYALWQKSCIVSICCANSVRRMPHMVDIAQPVEQLIVVQQVARSSRVIHPTSTPRQAGFLFSVCAVRHVAGHGERPDAPDTGSASTWAAHGLVSGRSEHAGHGFRGFVRPHGILSICVCHWQALCDRRAQWDIPKPAR